MLYNLTGPQTSYCLLPVMRTQNSRCNSSHVRCTWEGMAVWNDSRSWMEGRYQRSRGWGCFCACGLWRDGGEQQWDPGSQFGVGSGRMLLWVPVWSGRGCEVGKSPGEGSEPGEAILSWSPKTKVSVCGVCEDVGREMHPVSATRTGETGVCLPSCERRRCWVCAWRSHISSGTRTFYIEIMLSYKIRSYSSSCGMNKIWLAWPTS